MKDKKTEHSSTKSSRSTDRNTSNPDCDNCSNKHKDAKTGSDPGRCRYKDHEDANHKGPWKYSKVGEKYAELRPDRPSLDFRHKLNADGTKLIDRPYDETSASKTPKSDKKERWYERYGVIPMYFVYRRC